MHPILVLNGSASEESSNQRLIDYLSVLGGGQMSFQTFRGLKALPHFDPALSLADTPRAVLALREEIASAHGLLICSPEYILSLPSGLKNAIEWCISTNVFVGKPTALITASASGTAAHDQLQLIMKTAMANFTRETTLLIPGIAGKFDPHGGLRCSTTEQALKRLLDYFGQLVDQSARCSAP